jgi:acetyl esterase/lipase
MRSAQSASCGVDAKRIGILGFSAGGNAAGMTALLPERQYAAVDDVDKTSSRPDFVVLVYAAGFLDKENRKLRDDLKVSKDTPPMFIVHAHNDEVSSLHSALLYVALKQVGASAELHIYAKGGHGYGLRQTAVPVTSWPARLEAWLNTEGWTRH